MRLAEWFDALTGGREAHRARRKELRVGENFDDYVVHAGAHAVSSDSQLSAATQVPSSSLDESLSARRLALPSATHRRVGSSRSNYERSFDRPRTPRGHSTAPWKRTVSAPRALSEFTHLPPAAHGQPTPAPPMRSLSHLARHRHQSSSSQPRREIIAPNEKPVSRNSFRTELPSPEIMPLPVGEPPPAPLPPDFSSPPLSSPPPSSPSELEHQLRTTPEPFVDKWHMLPRRTSSKRVVTSSSSPAPDNIHGSTQTASPDPNTSTHWHGLPRRASSKRVVNSQPPSPPLDPTITAVSEPAPPVGTIAPMLPRRTPSKRVKKRPPPLITTGAPHGFAAAGLREATPIPDADMNPSIVVLTPPKPDNASTPTSSRPFGGSSSLLSLKRSNSRQRSAAVQQSAGVTTTLKRTNSRQRSYQQQQQQQAAQAAPQSTAKTHSQTHSHRHGGGSMSMLQLHRSSSRSLLHKQQQQLQAQGTTQIEISGTTPIEPPPRLTGITMMRSNSQRRGVNGSTAHVHAQPARISAASAAPSTGDATTTATLALHKSNSRSRLHYSSAQSVKRAAAVQRALVDRSSAQPLVTRLIPDDLLFEEATSISSLGEGDTLGRGTRGRDIEVQEDVFVIGGDGVFKGGGFEISKNGMLKSPGNLTRKLSDGTAVDGVPRSSNNLIYVRSLAEFTRGAPLSSRSRRMSAKIDSTLGAGAAGRVSLAVHRPSGRKIAVKRINVFDCQKRTQLLKELETLMCYDSRFLVRSYGAFYDGEGVVHVTLEYMDRGALSDAVELRGAVPEHITKHIAEHCLRGLRFLHENHVLHRDFKTSNILLSRRTCRAKLADFGLARELQNGESRVDTFVGTVGYMAPERLNGREYTYASDVWALGICVLECLLGRYPFPKPQNYFDYLHAAQQDPAQLVRSASADCVDFVRLCTAEDPKLRPTASQLLEHPWIAATSRDTNAFREWLDSVPLAHDAAPASGAMAGLDAVDGLRKAKERDNVLERARPSVVS